MSRSTLNRSYGRRKGLDHNGLRRKIIKKIKILIHLKTHLLYVLKPFLRPFGGCCIVEIDAFALRFNGIV